MDRLTLRCWNPVQAHQELQSRGWPWLKAMLTAGHKMQVRIERETRSLKQNALLHDLLTDISKQLPWAGKKRDVDTWKRLMVAAWCRAHNEQIELLPALDGHGVDIVFRRTSQMSVAELTDLITFIQAWCAEQGLAYTDPATGELIGA